MTNYLFIESRDPFESRDTQFVEETATALKQRGHEVTVFLVQNGVGQGSVCRSTPYQRVLMQKPEVQSSAFRLSLRHAS